MTKTRVIIGIVIVCTAFASGRYLTPERIRIEEKIVEVEKKSTDTERNKHKETEVTEKVNPDGSKETTTKIVEDSNTQKKTDSEKTTDQSRSEERTRTKVTLAALAGLPVSSLTRPVYGAAVSADVIGPMNAGIFALTDGIIGISIGLTF